MIDTVVNILVISTLILMMLRIGLDVVFSEVVATAKDWRLVTRALIANYVLVPGLTVTLLLATHVRPIISVAFLILSVCPGAPFGPPLTAMAKGAVGTSVGLMVILAGSSGILAPMLLRLLLRYISGDESLHVDAVAMFRTLLVTQLLPLSAGLTVRLWRPDHAARIKKAFDLATNVLLLITFSVVLAVQYRILIEIRLIGYFAMLGLSIASLAIGWFSGGADPGIRKALGLTTAFRNAGLAMVIASGSFAGTPVLSAVVAFTIVSTLGTVAPALWWGKRTSPSFQRSGVS
jgi:BASS family bile acid:Na+ symporter